MRVLQMLGALLLLVASPAFANSNAALWTVTQRSGDVLVAYRPGWLEGYSGPSTKGASHGTAGRYDTHVPLIFYGWNVKKGSSAEEVYITDIAATLAQWLKIQEPNGSIGKPLQPKMK